MARLKQFDGGIYKSHYANTSYSQLEYKYIIVGIFFEFLIRLLSKKIFDC